MVPVSVMLPPAVTLRLPPMLEAARATPVVLVMLAWPVAPLVLSVMGPVTVWVSSVMSVFAVDAV